MKTTLTRFIALIVLLVIGIFSISSCNKSGDNASNSSFTWTYGTTSYTANFKGAYLTWSLTPVIMGGTGTQQNSPGTGPTIALSSFSTGSYNLATSPNSILYVDDLGFTVPSATGTVTITAYSNNRVSGNFSAALTNSVALSGSFANIPVNP